MIAGLQAARSFVFHQNSLGTGDKVQEGVGRKNRILKGTVLVAHPS